MVREARIVFTSGSQLGVFVSPRGHGTMSSGCHCKGIGCRGKGRHAAYLDTAFPFLIFPALDRYLGSKGE